MPRFVWSKKIIDDFIRNTAPKYSSLEKAINAAFGIEVSVGATSAAFKRHGYHSPLSYLKIDSEPIPDLEAVLEDIKAVAQTLSLDPAHFNSVSHYVSVGGKFSKKQIKMLGGFSSLISTYFTPRSEDALAHHRVMNKHKSYVASLERRLGDLSIYHKEFIGEVIKAAEKAGPVQISKINKPEIKIKNENSKLRENCAFLSDTHFGLYIDSDEVGVNSYSWPIAARRLGKFTDQIATFKEADREDCPQLRLAFGGDLGQGIIHTTTEAGTDLITHQVIGISRYLIAMIDHLRHHYKKIIVECTPDNHMRLTHKGPDRQRSQKADSFATMVYAMTEAGFRTVDDVTFNIPNCAITSYDVLGNRIALTHGDTHVNTGSVGSTVNIGKIVNQVMRLNVASREERPYKAILLGHVHTPLYMPLQECNTDLVINGSMSGTDGYAFAEGFYTNHPSQWLWESTEAFPIGDIRKIDLADADEEVEYEKIIKPYDYTYHIDKNLHLIKK